MKLGQLKETDIINSLSDLIKNSQEVMVGMGDDAAVIEKESGKFILFTTDMLIQDIHFNLGTKDITPQDIGRKLLAVNLSDIGAMGGIPKYAVVSAGMPKNISLNFLHQIYKGISLLAKGYKVDIVGGDLSSCHKVFLNLALVGEVDNNILLRKNAQKGEGVFVTGELGGSRYGKHFSFLPRIEESNFLKSRFNISSMIDISDGLVKDAYRIAQASGVKIKICKNRIPLSKCANSVEEALYEGEDFELLFTVEASHIEGVKKSQPINDIPVTHIGTIERGKPEVILYDENKGKEISLEIKGYDHFI